MTKEELFSTFAVGTKVKIISPGRCYSKFNTMAKQMFGNDSRYMYGHKPMSNSKGVVEKLQEHPNQKDVCIGVNTATGLYIMDYSGIELDDGRQSCDKYRVSGRGIDYKFYSNSQETAMQICYGLFKDKYDVYHDTQGFVFSSSDVNRYMKTKGTKEDES